MEFQMGKLLLSRILRAALALCLFFVVSLAAQAQDNILQAAGTKAAEVAQGVSNEVENRASDLASRADESMAGITETFATINDLLNKFAAVIAVVFVVLLGILLRYVANMVFIVLAALLILFNKREWARDMRAVIEGMIGLGIIVGCAFAWFATTRAGLVAGIEAGLSAQALTWIVTITIALISRFLFPQRLKIFAEIKELAK